MLLLASCSVLVFTAWNSPYFNEAYHLVFTRIAPQATTLPQHHPLYELLILGGAGLAIPLFWYFTTLSWRVHVLVFMGIVAAIAASFVAGLQEYDFQLPAIEWASLVCLSGLLSCFEKLHQRPLQKLQLQQQRLGLLAAEHQLQQQLLSAALSTLGELKVSDNSLELGYRIGQQAERKRDYSTATRTYQWLLQHKKGYRDCAERLQHLGKITKPSQGMSQTIAIDGTLLLPTEGLQPPTLGRYRIESVLGKGAMGVVYRGVDPAINREVAIKTLALGQEFEGAEQQVARSRFFREAETAGKLNHPNIVTIYDVGEEHDLAFIAMDLLPGVALDRHAKKPDLVKPVMVYQLMIQIASALAYAHDKGVVHRDIKPGNLIYDNEKHKVIITDFGIAHLTDQSKTRTGAILGSPFYMSPEQVQGQKVDGRSDIFSLGVTFYQLLTGKLPFKGDSLAAVALNITTQKHEPIRKLRTDLPQSASRIVNKALNKEKDRRYQNVAEMREALITALKRDFNTEPFQ